MISKLKLFFSVVISMKISTESSKKHQNMQYHSSLLRFGDVILCLPTFKKINNCNIVIKPLETVLAICVNYKKCPSLTTTLWKIKAEKRYMVRRKYLYFSSINLLCCNVSR